MLRYRYLQQGAGPGGEALLVTALTADWVPAAADVLTESFATALGAAPYVNFLKRQVKVYLEQHRKLPPKAVVLVALLLPPELAAAVAAERQQEQQALAGLGDAASSSGSGSDSEGGWQAGVNEAGSSGGDVLSASSRSSVGVASQPLAGALSSSWQQQAELQQVQGLQQAQAEAEGAEMGDGMAINPMLSRLAVSSSSESDSGSGSGSDGESFADGGDAAALQRQRQQQALLGPGGGVELVGVVELSFSASTRSKYVTLNSPEDRPYLCNMAVNTQHRGRGFGFALLQAAEQLVSELGENEVYLHLRVQDTPAAGLYLKSGYQEVSADTFLVRFLGMDQRRLLRKRLPRAKPAAAGAAAGAAAASPAAGQAAAAQGVAPAAPAPLPSKKLKLDL